LSKLGQLLSYLERPGVTELVFRSGVPAVMRSANRLHPLTVTPLQVSQIRRFFDGTPVMARLAKSDEIPQQTLSMELLGVSYQVTIGGAAGSLEVRIAKDTQTRSSTWTELPAVDVPVMRERRPSTGEGEAALPPTSPGILKARPFPLERDSSSGMLAASPEWIIERNDDHGRDLATSVAATRRDVIAIPPPDQPQPEPAATRRSLTAAASPRVPELDDAVIRRDASAPAQVTTVRPGSAPAPVAPSRPGSAPIVPSRPASAPAPVAPSRPGSAPAPAARARAACHPPPAPLGLCLL
jgi:hypothetical protein